MHGQYFDDMEVLKQELPGHFTGLLYITNQAYGSFTKAVTTLDILEVMLYLPNGKKTD